MKDGGEGGSSLYVAFHLDIILMTKQIASSLFTRQRNSTGSSHKIVIVFSHFYSLLLAVEAGKESMTKWQ